MQVFILMLIQVFPFDTTEEKCQTRAYKLNLTKINFSSNTFLTGKLIKL